jgi:electron transport complex protein RnfC
MRRWRFHGGVHTHDEEKPRTRGLPIETQPPPAKVVMPLQQHIGAPAKPLVKKGDAVAVGQPLAEAAGFVSVPVHSPVSGKVVEVGRCAHPLGMAVDAVVVENDGQDRPAPGVGEPAGAEVFNDPKAIRDRIRDAGICGMGGAGFPTHVKLSPPDDKPIDTLVVNGAECEPALSADHRLMLEEPEGVMRGVRHLRRALERKGASPRAVLAVEENKLDAAEALEKARTALGVECEIVTLPVRYPQGAEKQLIYALLGREVPPLSERGLPMDVGCVVQNVGTAFAAYEALERGRPLIERVLTLAGDAVGRPANVRARLGTAISELLAAREVSSDASTLILGGPMMGVAQYADDMPVMKTTSGVLVELARAGDRFYPCIRCGRCVDVCPMGLVPSRLSVLAESGRFEEMAGWSVVDCIECGCCAYGCPAKRPIVHQVKLGKWMLAEARKKVRAEGGAA